jgi:hypothetical protein
VEWNRILFEEVLPQAWKHVFEHFTTNLNIRDVFSLWPAEQPDRTTGDVAYWAQLPENLVRTSSDTHIWPIHCPSAEELYALTTATPSGILSKDQHAKLDVVLLAPRGEHDDLCNILAAAGVNVTQVPMYIYRFLINVYCSSVLQPRRVWKKLSEVGIQ